MRLPTYKRHVTGRAFTTIRGKDFYLGPYDSPESKEAFGRLLAEYLSTDAKHTFKRKPSELLIVELIASYLDYAREYYGTGPNSEFLRIRTVTKTLGKLYGDTLAEEFGPTRFKAVRYTLLETKTPKGNYPSRVYVNRQMKRLIGMFRWASGEELLPTTIHQTLSDVKILKAGKTKAVELERVEPVDVAIVEATIKHLPPVVKDMVKFQSLAGCRPSEVCSIKPSMVDRSNTVWEIRFDKHKTVHHGKKRIIYVGPKAQAVLLPYLIDRHEDAFCFDPRDSMHRRRERNVPASCGNRRGKSNTKRKTSRRLKDHYTTATYGNAIRRACRENKIQHWAPNQLRHLVGTNVRKELGIESASVILGHSNLSTTQIYAEADRELAIEAAKKLG